MTFCHILAIRSWPQTPHRFTSGPDTETDFESLPIERPPTWNDDLSTKPFAQRAFRFVADAGNGLVDEHMPESPEPHPGRYP